MEECRKACIDACFKLFPKSKFNYLYCYCLLISLIIYCFYLFLFSDILIKNSNIILVRITKGTSAGPKVDLSLRLGTS
jgi:hypothetical protein